jgi:hypothetical protein
MAPSIPGGAVSFPAAESADRQDRASDIFRALAAERHRTRIGFDEIVRAFGNRGYGLLMLALTIPTLVPIPLPGISTLFGLPLGFVALQMLLGRPRPWLPQALLQRSVRHADFAMIVARSLPWLERIERALHPRWTRLAEGVVQRWVGALCLVLALLLALPLPLTGIPLALPVTILSAGLLERDGAAVVVGSVLGIAGGILAVLIGVALFKGLLLLLHSALA